MEPIPVNLELVRRRSADLRTELLLLQGYAALDENAFLSNPQAIRAARYSLIVAVEAAAAICGHISARRGRAPDSYPGCFETLVDLGILEKELGTRLAAMARFRNLLVHGYGRIDDQRLHGILRDNLGDMDRYLAAIALYLGLDKEPRT